MPSIRSGNWRRWLFALASSSPALRRSFLVASVQRPVNHHDLEPPTATMNMGRKRLEILVAKHVKPVRRDLLLHNSAHFIQALARHANGDTLPVSRAENHALL